MSLAALGATWLAQGDGYRHRPEALAASEAAIGLISDSLSALPFRVYQEGEAGRVEVAGHPFLRLTRRGVAGGRLTFPGFVSWLVRQALTYGNGLAKIESDGRGVVVDFLPIPWRGVSVEVSDAGRIIYVCSGDGLFAPRGQTVRLLPHEVLHLRCPTDDGLIGVAPLARARAASEAAVEIDATSRALWKNLTKPAYVLMHEKSISEGAAARLKRQFEGLIGGSGKGKGVLLEEGLKFEGVEIQSAESAEALDSRRFTVEEIARVFAVPTPLIGSMQGATLTNVAHLRVHFAQSTLSTWARRLEAEMARALFSDDEIERMSIEVDLSGILRGDAETRFKSWDVALRYGVLTVNEVREAEGYGPMPAVVPERET
ncbi:phage portal protein [Alloyangia pacifica]|uniref:Phage portal protein, HK97 family n=1 Tax=Alloyangia pacifica TaxID=311180 RepID=A0A1I6WI79_9RHOB|nr:phage portal protein [Alloyangia pacifica]SDI78819.1 phage portal protein, HK97 family [Alloyangia pacifica]SFT25689.1 phage portal protein, HK97 family [Alloyangia pacifica]